MTSNLSEAIYRHIGRSPVTRYFEVAYILLLPIALVFLYRFSPFNNDDGFLDSWIYFAYTHNFQDLIDRYGFPYYSVRHGLIFPLIALVKIFGPVEGYLAFVYSMYLVAGIPLYLLFRKRFSIHAALLAYAILVSSVWLARTVLWTHPDASAVPYLVAAIALMFLDARRNRMSSLAVGMLIGLAVNSNVFALSIGGLMGIAYLVYYKGTLWQRLRQDIPWMTAGFLVVFAVGAVGYYVCCGQINYFRSTLDMILWSTRGSGHVYQAPLSEILKLNYLYLPPFLLGAMAITLSKAGLHNRSILFAVSGYLGATIAFYAWYEFSTKTAVLEYFYYFSFFLAPCIICMSIIPVILARAGNSETHLLNLAIASFLLPPLIIAYRFVEIVDHLSVYWIWAGFLFALLILWLAGQFTKLIPYAIVVFALSIHVSLLSTVIKGIPFPYARMYGMADDVGLSRYRLGLKFIETMPKFREEKRPIYFWYLNNDGLANSLQSTYLWGYSRLPDFNNGVGGYPAFTGENLVFLQKQERFSLVLFDRNKRNVDRGIEELRHVALQFSIKKIREICERTICYTIAVLDVNGLLPLQSKQDWQEGRHRPLNVALDWSLPGAGAILERNTAIASVVTHPKAWNYGAVASMEFSDPPPAEHGMIRILVSVREASAGLGFTGRNISTFIKRVEVLPKNEPQELFFEIDNLGELHHFVIQTWDQDKSAKVQILEFSVRALPHIPR